MSKIWSANSFYYDEKQAGIGPGVQYDTVVVNGEPLSGLSGTLDNAPIIPGSVVFTNGMQTFVDIGVIESTNGAGILFSSLSPHSGTINYTTGQWTVTGWEGLATRTAAYMAATSPSNLLVDGALAIWSSSSVLGYWTLGHTAGSSTLTRVTSPVYNLSTYAAEVTATSGTGYIYQNYVNYLTYANQLVTITAWVWSALAGTANVMVTDGVVTNISAYHPGDSNWHQLTVNLTLSNVPSQLRVYLQVAAGGTSYFDSVIMSVGTQTTPIPSTINWDEVLFPTIDGVTSFVPLKDRYIADELGTLNDVSILTGIEEYSKYVDLLSLMPEKFRSSVALQQLLYVFGLQVGTWIGEINDLETILDKWSVGPDYIQYLADLVGLQLVNTPTTTYQNLQEQLLQVIDWYKMKGTYQALKVVGYTLGLDLNLWDLYTQDYINFVMEPWYTGPVGTNPPGLSSSYYKSPHLGIEIALDKIKGIAPNYYFFDGSNTYNNLITYIERVRPINVVPQYSLFLNPICNRAGTVQGDKYTTTSSTSITIPSQSACPVNVTLMVGAGLPFLVNQNISVVYDNVGESYNQYMDGTVFSYNAVTGQLVVTVTYVVGAGTYNSWIIIGNIRSIVLSGWVNSQVNYDSSYSTGTVSIGTGTTTLMGVGTLWTQNVAVGDSIGFGTTNPSSVTTWYGVSAINSDTSITIDSGNISGESISGTSGTLVHHPIVGGSLVLTDGYETYADNGFGHLVSTVSTGLSGDINYTTGVWSIPSWVGSGPKVASYQVTKYVGTTLSGSTYVVAPYYDSLPPLTYDLTQSSFYQSISVWRLGTGNVGVVPNPMFTLQNPVLTNWEGIIYSPISVNIQTTYVEFSFQLPNTITQSGITELGLYLSNGTSIQVGCTFPSINLVSGESLRVVVHVNY